MEGLTLTSHRPPHHKCRCSKYAILLAMKESNSSQMRDERMSKVSGKGFVYILKDDHFKSGVKIGRQAHESDADGQPLVERLH